MRIVRSLLGILVLVWASTPSRGAIMTFNSNTPAGNTATRDDWLNAIGITLSQVQHTVDFESGFTNGQNVSAVSGLFPGGLVITDTSATHEALITNVAGSINGSNPVDTYALTQNEMAYLKLDFTSDPVDYVSFQDIDHTGTTIRIHLVGGEVVTTNIEATGVSGNTAEFFGIFRNDQPKITCLELDSSGDGLWGIDNLRYGSVAVVPDPSAPLLGLAGLGTMLLTRKHRQRA